MISEKRPGLNREARHATVLHTAGDNMAGDNIARNLIPQKPPFWDILNVRKLQMRYLI